MIELITLSRTFPQFQFKLNELKNNNNSYHYSETVLFMNEEKL